MKLTTTVLLGLSFLAACSTKSDDPGKAAATTTIDACAKDELCLPDVSYVDTTGRAYTKKDLAGEGSSPRMRGAVREGQALAGHAGIIPAHAGSRGCSGRTG